MRDLAERGDRPSRASRASVPRSAEDLLDLPPDPERRVQRAPGVLVDHRNDVAPIEPAAAVATQAEDVPADDLERPAGDAPVSRQVPDDRVGHGRLATARLADEPVARRLVDSQ